MKRLATISAVLVVALPLLAGDKASEQKAAKKQQPATTQAAEPRHTPEVQLAAPSTETVVSPLVAAARRTNRGARKSAIVITNETLAGKGARVTTTASQAPISSPPSTAAAEWQSLEQQAAMKAEAKRKAELDQKKRADAEAARKRRMAQIAGQYEDDSLANDVDPARAEHQLDAASGQKPQPQKPPQE